MNRNSAFGTTLYFVLSAMFHASAALLIITIPQLELLPEGGAETIEFTTAETPQGEQLHTPAVTTAALEAPVAKIDEPAPTKKNESPTRPPARKAPVPTKEEVATPTEAQAEVEVPVVATPVTDLEPTENSTPPVAETEIETETPEETAESEVTPEPEALPNEIETTPDAIEKVETTPEAIESPATDAPAAVAPMPVEENSVDAKESETPSTVNSESAGAEDAAAAAAVESFGSPTSQVRSYEELRQTPGNRAPQYPVAARRQNQQGQVQLAYYVKGDGTIENLKMLKSSGYPLLDQEAYRAVSLFRYQPGQEGWTIHPVDFQLQGPVKKLPSRLRTSSR